MTRRNFLASLLMLCLTCIDAPLSADEKGNLYDLAIPLIDHNGEEVALDHFRGNTVLVTMFYATCPHACPVTINELRQTDKALAKSDQEKVRYLLVSFDAERDTPQELKEVVDRYELDTDRFLLTVPERKKDIALIAAALGIQFKKLEDGEFGHSSIGSVATGTGELVYSGQIEPAKRGDLIQALQTP